MAVHTKHKMHFSYSPLQFAQTLLVVNLQLKCSIFGTIKRNYNAENRQPLRKDINKLGNIAMQDQYSS